MIRATLNGTVLAEAAKTVRVEGNHYFPPETVQTQYLRKTHLHTLCYWKGLASYYSAETDGLTARNVAWYYPHPSPLARKIRNHVAFGPKVMIEETPDTAGERPDDHR